MIRFDTDDSLLPDLSIPALNRWIREVALSHGKKTGEINYVFCSDARMLEHNIAYLDHDFYTDIITFDYSEGQVISGDIFIGAETVASNAAQMGLNEGLELLRVIIHGILHLCGFKDKTPMDEANMHEKEDTALILWNGIVNQYQL